MEVKEQYETICKPYMESILAQNTKEHSAILTELNGIKQALFIGNGQPSIKQQLATGAEKMRQYDKALNWVWGVIATITSGLSIAAIVAILRVVR